jgi:hypothetical protein
VLSIRDLEEISAARLLDGKVLYGARRFDGAFYISGYAIELALKARICKTLQWNGFPDTNKEFERFSSFRVHDLAVLLKLTGLESIVMTQHVAEWSIVAAWKPQARYAQIGTVGERQANRMLEAIEILVREL